MEFCPEDLQKYTFDDRIGCKIFCLVRNFPNLLPIRNEIAYQLSKIEKKKKKKKFAIQCMWKKN